MLLVAGVCLLALMPFSTTTPPIQKGPYAGSVSTEFGLHAGVHVISRVPHRCPNLYTIVPIRIVTRVAGRSSSIRTGSKFGGPIQAMQTNSARACVDELISRAQLILRRLEGMKYQLRDLKSELTEFESGAEDRVERLAHLRRGLPRGENDDGSAGQHADPEGNS